MKNHVLLEARMGLLDRIVSAVRVFAIMIAAVVIVRSNVARCESSAAETSGSSASGDSLKMAGGASATVKVTRDARGRKVQYVDFSEAVIEGKARAPEGFVIQSRSSGRFNSLIELRSNFRENMNIHALEGATLPPSAE